jgi:hypothetical protein
MCHLRMVEIKAKMVVNQRECITYGWYRLRQRWSLTKENVSLTDGRDQGDVGRHPEGRPFLMMLVIKARMIANQKAYGIKIKIK